MTDILIRIEGHAGRITLNRPEALNALTYQMCLEIEEAMDAWRDNDLVRLVIFDAEGDRAFCAGGDIVEMYQTGTAGDFGYGQKFWADEYRMNFKIFHYPKPVVSFLQGFTMGGGVGVGCHGSHRVVGESSQIAMPECGIGLVPDVGGSLMLALAPGRLGEYLGLTGARMGPGDAIYAGFADIYAPETTWPDLIARLAETGDASILTPETPPDSPLQAQQAEIDAHFGGQYLQTIVTSLSTSESDFATKALKLMMKSAPVSQACTLEILRRLQGPSVTLAKALDLEYRFTARSMEHGDFLEGIRAQVIDKDRTPHWQYADEDVPLVKISQMLMPLPDLKLDLG